MKELGKHEYTGICQPGDGKCIYFETFSVGVFEWIGKAGTKGNNPEHLKKSVVKVRVYGLVKHPEKVYDKALEICALLDAGTYDGPKKVKV